MNCSDGLTIFIPVFNEEALLLSNTLHLRAYLEAMNRPYEIIIGSNGSTDRSVQIGRSLSKKYPQIRLFHLSKKGVGMAFKEGVKRARYDRIITVDMDLSIRLDFISVGLSPAGPL
ncbi:MAG: glycosyltransferase [Deltaproteobacteria bacterium]|nr:glycosyltransferase [Deltaproteobacteria bacterium]